jgi:K+/H+ antiporter YhaU regulatory subunit KhtT
VSRLRKEVERAHTHEIDRLREESLDEHRKLKSLHEKEMANVRKLLKETDHQRNRFEDQHRNLLQEIEQVLR